MSIILNALRKSEQERFKGPVPGIGPQPQRPVRTGRAWPWQKLAAGALAANLAIAAVAIWILHDAAAPSNAPAPERAVAGPAGQLAALPPAAVAVDAQPRALETAAGTPNGPAVPQGAAATPAEAPEAPEAPEEGVDTELAAAAPGEVAAEADAEAAGVEGQAPVAAELRPAPAPAGGREAAATAPPRPAARRPRVLPAPEPAEPAPREVAALPVTAPPAAEPEPEPAEPPAPKIDPYARLPIYRQLAPSLRDRVPEFRILVHVYYPETDDGFVVTNLGRYVAGERMTEELTLDAIVADGVVLRFEETQFRVGAH